MVDLREAQIGAAKTGIGLQYVLKESRVFDIWAKVSPILLSKELSSQATIICKGGTPLNKIFLGELQRFSEDLDFDIFFKKKVEREEKIQFIKDNVINILNNSYTIPKEARRRRIVRFTCYFKNEMGKQDNVFMEFNIDETRVGSLEIRKAESKILPLSVGNVPVYSFHTLVAKKLKTFYEREEGKDVYDLYYSLKVTDDIKKVVPVLKDILTAAKIHYDEFVKEFPKKLADSRKMRSLHASTNPYIPRNLRINFVDAARAISKSVVRYL